MSDSKIDAISIYMKAVEEHVAAEKAGTPLPLSPGTQFIIEAMRIIDAADKAGREFREQVEALPEPNPR